MANIGMRAEAIAAVLRSGEPMRIGEIADALDQDHKLVGQALAGMAVRGSIERVGTGTYRWTGTHRRKTRRRSAPRSGSNPARVMAAMQDGQPSTHAQIAAATGLSKAIVASTLSRIARTTGAVTHVDAGRYQLASGNGQSSRAAQVVATAVKSGYAPAVGGNVTITLAPKQAARLIEWLLKEAM